MQVTMYRSRDGRTHETDEGCANWELALDLCDALMAATGVDKNSMAEMYRSDDTWSKAWSLALTIAKANPDKGRRILSSLNRGGSPITPKEAEL